MGNVRNKASWKHKVFSSIWLDPVVETYCDFYDVPWVHVFGNKTFLEIDLYHLDTDNKILFVNYGFVNKNPAFYVSDNSGIIGRTVNLKLSCQPSIKLLAPVGD